MDPVIHDNIRCVEQAIELLEELPSHVYIAKCEASLGASVGGHIRHNIDHYSNFLAQAKSCTIDYDARNRDRSIEEDAEAAIQNLKAIILGLETLSGLDLDQPLRVTVNSGSTDACSVSSLRRELQFLLSHSIHHYAIIAIVCRIHEVEVGEAFGVAPSTLDFRQHANGSMSPCAH